MIDDVFRMTDDTTAVLSVHAQPGAGRTEVVGRHGDSLKIRVAAPPEDGRANQAIVKLLVARFDVAPSAVELVSGASGRMKSFKVSGVEAPTVRRVLERLVHDGGDARKPSGRGRR